MKAVLSKSVGGPETLVLEEVADPVERRDGRIDTATSRGGTGSRKTREWSR